MSSSSELPAVAAEPEPEVITIEGLRRRAANIPDPYPLPQWIIHHTIVDPLASKKSEEAHLAVSFSSLALL